MLSVSCLLFLVACAGICGVSQADGKSELRARAINTILSTDGIADVRPDGPNDTVRVNMGFNLNIIEDMDERAGALRVSGFLALMWNDSRMDIGNHLRDADVETVRLDASKVWIPDIAMYYAAAPGLQMLNPSAMREKVIVTEGRVAWVPLVSATVPCSPPRGENPDKVYCMLRFGSWTYSGFELDLHPTSEEAGLGDFMDTNPTWTLAGTVRQRRSVLYYDCCKSDREPTPYVIVDVFISLKRREH